MALLSTNAISHFMHPAHKLHLTTNTSSNYICDACMVPGKGSHYNCAICNFTLHNYCAKCPTRLTSTTSHHHPMSLIVHKPTPNLTVFCQICHHPVKALAYECKDCNFRVHPLCVSTNSGHNQNHTVASHWAGPAALRIGEQIVGAASGSVVKNWLTNEPNKGSSLGSNVPVSVGVHSAASGSEVPSAGFGHEVVHSAASGYEVPSAGFGYADQSDASGYEVPTAASDYEVPSSGFEEGDEGFFDALMSGFSSFFESIFES